MPRGFPISKDIVEEMIRLKGEGASIRSISDAVGIDRRRVREKLNYDVEEEAKNLLNAELQKKREGGMFIHEIATLYGISYDSVKSRTKPPKNKLRRHPNYTSKEEMDSMLQRRREGFSLVSISKEFNRSLPVVRKACHSIESAAQAKRRDRLKRAFILGAVNVAVTRTREKLQVPEHVTRMKLSLMMSRGFSESEALAQAMSFYAHGKVTAADDDYQPRNPMVARKRVR